jgi:hypothetical protein
VPAVVPLRKHEGFDAVAKHGLPLDEIDDVETNPVMLLGVVNLKVKPLVVSLRVNVILEDQVVGLYL